MLMTKKDDTTTHGRRRFLHLLVSNQSAAHGISHLHFLLLLLSLSVPLVSAQPSSENDQQAYRNFNPSMAIIIIVLISAFFFMGFFSIYIRQCAEDRNGGSIRPANMVGRSRRAARGLDPAVIETFPTFMYSVVKGLQLGKGALECAVCLNEFEDDETLRLLPKCDHVFHPECIDAWLSSHTTCPVCRANLVPGSGEDAAALEQVPDDTNGESDVENPRPEVREDQSQGGSLHVIEEQNTEQQAAPDVISPCQVPIQNRPPRAKSSRRPRYTGKFPRSHSTGHSLVQPGENCDRFTLRLPEEVRKQIMKGRLNRTTSCVAFPTEGSTRRGYRSGGEGSSRGKSYNNNNTTSQLVGGMDRSAKSDRWVFSMTPPFFTRTFSTRSAKAGADGEAATTPKAFFTSVKTPFDCLGGKPEGAESSSTRPPV